MSTPVLAPPPIVDTPAMENTKVKKDKKRKDESSDSESESEVEVNENKHEANGNEDAASESSDDSNDKKKSKSKKSKSKKSKSPSKPKKKASESDDEDDETEKKSSSKKDKKDKKKGKKGKKKRKGAKKVKISEQYVNTGFDIRVPPVDTHIRAYIYFISTTGPIRNIERLREEKKEINEENLQNRYHWNRIKEAREEWETHCKDIHLKLHPEEKEKHDNVPVRRRVQTEKKVVKNKSGKVKEELTPAQVREKLVAKQAEIDEINGRDAYSKDIALLSRIRIRLNKDVPRYLTIFIDRLIARLTYNAYVNAMDIGRGKITPEHALRNARNNVNYFSILSGYKSTRFYEYRNDLIAQALLAKKKSKKSGDDVAAPSIDPTELPPFSFESSVGIPSVEELIAQCKKPKKDDGKTAAAEDDEEEEEEEEEEENDNSSDSDSDDEDDDKKKKKKKSSKKPAKPTLSFMTHTTQRCNSVKHELVEAARADTTSGPVSTADKYSYINISNEYRVMCRNIILEVLWRVAQSLISLADCSDFRTVGVNHIKVLLSVMMNNGGVEQRDVTEFFEHADKCIARLMAYNKSKNVRKVANRAARKLKEESGKKSEKKKTSDDDTEEQPKETNEKDKKDKKDKKKKKSKE